MSQNFDYDSIMLYDNIQGGLKTLESTQWDAQHGVWEGVWKGGNPDPQYKSISSGDIERIKELYPLNPGYNSGGTGGNLPPRSDAEAGNGTTGLSTGPSKWQPLKVEMPGILTTTVMPAPTYDASDEAAAATNTFAREFPVDTVD